MAGAVAVWTAVTRLATPLVQGEKRVKKSGGTGNMKAGGHHRYDLANSRYFAKVEVHMEVFLFFAFLGVCLVGLVTIVRSVWQFIAQALQDDHIGDTSAYHSVDDADDPLDVIDPVTAGVFGIMRNGLDIYHYHCFHDDD